MALGEQLEALCGKGKATAILVAPFIKASALLRVLQYLAPSVPLTCVTRWRPEEIAAGVSDLEVWDILKKRRLATLWLRPDLHAKYYRVDERCLLGSANLTNNALGWSYSPNLEILVELGAADPQLEGFETQLMKGSVPVDDDLYQQMRTAVELLPKQDMTPMVIAIREGATRPEAKPAIGVGSWLPTLRMPESLYTAYAGHLEQLTTASQKAAVDDLRMLQVPPQLAKPAFHAYLGGVLLQYPIIQAVDRFVAEPQRFGAVRELLDSLPCATVPDFDASSAWQTLMRWLMFFLPRRYVLETPNYSEIFQKVPVTM